MGITIDGLDMYGQRYDGHVLKEKRIYGWGQVPPQYPEQSLPLNQMTLASLSENKPKLY